MALLQHPWLARIRPSAVLSFGSTQVALYTLAPTNLHRLSAEVLILPTDPTLRMTRGIRKQVRDFGGYRLIEDEAVSMAPLPPGGIAITSGGRTQFRKIFHTNMYDAQYTTTQTIQREMLQKAFEVAIQQGARTIAVSDYTLDMRRAVAEETLFAILSAWQPFVSQDLTLKLITTRPINGWAFEQVLGWVAQNDLKPYPYALRLRHTLLHAPPTSHWEAIPAEGLWHLTNTELGGAQSQLAKKGGAILQQKVRELAPLELGQCTITPAGNLAQQFVIHLAVMPSGQPLSLEALQRALPQALELAHNQNLYSIVVPMADSQGEPFVSAVLDAIETYLYRTLLTRIERLIFVSSQSALWQSGIQRLREQTELPALESAGAV